MALAVVGMALALRPMGAALAVIGGLALAFSPSFWIQTGGAESLNPLEVGGGADRRRWSRRACSLWLSNAR